MEHLRIEFLPRTGLWGVFVLGVAKYTWRIRCSFLRKKTKYPTDINRPFGRSWNCESSDFVAKGGRRKEVTVGRTSITSLGQTNVLSPINAQHSHPAKPPQTNSTETNSAEHTHKDIERYKGTHYIADFSKHRAIFRLQKEQSECINLFETLRRRSQMPRHRASSSSPVRQLVSEIIEFDVWHSIWPCVKLFSFSSLLGLLVDLVDLVDFTKLAWKMAATNSAWQSLQCRPNVFGVDETCSPLRFGA